jgi:ferredoxin-NADP reductase
MNTGARARQQACGAGAGPGCSAPSPRRIQILQVTVANVIVETRDTVTLVFDRPPQDEYRAGQSLTIDPRQFSSLLRFIQRMEMLKGRTEPPRAYSMTSAPHEPLAITIKEETWTPGQQKYPTVLSPYLVHGVKPGLPVTISGFSGSYHLPADIETRTGHIVHLCEGSGIVPNWSIVKAALRAHPRLRHTFLYSNMTWDDIIFRDALHALTEANVDRLRVIHLLTAQKDLRGLPPKPCGQGRSARSWFARWSPTATRPSSTRAAPRCRRGTGWRRKKGASRRPRVSWRASAT